MSFEDDFALPVKPSSSFCNHICSSNLEFFLSVFAWSRERTLQAPFHMTSVFSIFFLDVSFLANLMNPSQVREIFLVGGLHKELLILRGLPLLIPLSVFYLSDWIIPDSSPSYCNERLQRKYKQLVPLKAETELFCVCACVRRYHNTSWFFPPSSKDMWLHNRGNVKILG